MWKLETFIKGKRLLFLKRVDGMKFERPILIVVLLLIFLMFASATVLAQDSDND